MDEKRKVKYRIGTLGMLILFFVAALFDILSIIPGVGTLTGWMFWAGAGVYFWIVGLGIANWRVITPSLISVVWEFFPGIQAFPSILGGVLAIIILSRFEDKTGLSVLPGGKKGVRSPPKVAPLNQGGKRVPQQEDEIAEEGEELDMAA